MISEIVEKDAYGTEHETMDKVFVDCPDPNLKSKNHNEQIKSLQDRLFRRKTEKIHKDDGQLSLFQVPEPDLSILEEPKAVTLPEHTRKKRGRKTLPENLPRIELFMNSVKMKSSAAALKIAWDRRYRNNWIISLLNSGGPGTFDTNMPAKTAKEPRMTSLGADVERTRPY